MRIAREGLFKSWDGVELFYRKWEPVQPWHPQQEMIARVLPNREGKAWVMRALSGRARRALPRLRLREAVDAEPTL